MKIKLDENLPLSVVAILESLGHEVDTARRRVATDKKGPRSKAVVIPPNSSAAYMRRQHRLQFTRVVHPAG